MDNMMLCLNTGHEAVFGLSPAILEEQDISNRKDGIIWVPSFVFIDSAKTRKWCHIFFWQFYLQMKKNVIY